MEHINFRREYPPRWNSILQVGVSTQYSLAGCINSDETYNFQVEVSTQMEQYTSGGSINLVLLSWEYQLRWKKYSIL
jgi:hypothetical protein